MLIESKRIVALSTPDKPDHPGKKQCALLQLKLSALTAFQAGDARRDVRQPLWKTIMTSPTRLVLLCCVLLLTACGEPQPPDTKPFQDVDADANGHTPATRVTTSANKAVEKNLTKDESDLEAARRGFIASDDPLDIRRADGTSIWTATDYAFLDGKRPASVHPALWRQEQLNNLHGLFKVADGVHQVRGYDLANMTIIDGRRGRIIVDPLTSVETARAAMALVEKNLGPRPLVAIIFTHSHVDHFGGVNALLESIKPGAAAPRIIAPQGFMEEAVSENVLAGTVMMRRARYMYGSSLARSERGHVGSGLGKQPALGTISIARPTDLITQTGQKLSLDGVRFVFQLVPESEAPAEMTFHLPEKRIWCGAELVSRTLHNLYTLRGAKVRDALKWSGYIQQAIDLFAADTDTIINSHHWPVWGNDNARRYLAQQRDLYKFIHDQTLRLASQGLTPPEIAEQLKLPASLTDSFANHGFYGTLKHNARAVYQFYFGWYDGNPAHLNPLPPNQTAGRYVEAMGGAKAVKARARTAYDDGDYRWAAELLNHVVFADPDDAQARELLARSYDQLGYQAESAPWRDNYLAGALELRKGVVPPVLVANSSAMLQHIPMEQFFNAIATLLNGDKAAGKQAVINLNFSDTREQYVLWLENAVLHHRQGSAEGADFSLTLTRTLWQQLLLRQAGLSDLLLNDDFKLDGDRLKLLDFLSLLDQPQPDFAIVEP